MGNEGEINKECGGFLSWKGKRCSLGVGEELEVQKEREILRNKGSIRRVWLFEKSRTYYSGSVAHRSKQLK